MVVFCYNTKRRDCCDPIFGSHERKPYRAATGSTINARNRSISVLKKFFQEQDSFMTDSIQKNDKDPKYTTILDDYDGKKLQ